LFECVCGKKYKTKKGFENHLSKCKYVDLDKEKVLHLGNIINDVYGFFEPTSFEMIKEKKKNKNLSQTEIKKLIIKNNILKYKKMIWDVYTIWKDSLLGIEYRMYLKWLKKNNNFKDLNIINFKNVVTNKKLLLKYNYQNLFNTIEERINDSLDFIKNKEFANDFEFIDNILIGNISIYYLIFNDYLATNWFSKIDSDLQKELIKIIKQVEKTITNNISREEFDYLNTLANKKKPKIHDF
jgi:hypothetical protein